MGKGKGDFTDVDNRGLFLVARKIGVPEIDKIMEDAYGFEYWLPDRTPLTPLPSYDLEDRISNMPDDILQSIISCLPMKEGAATCILSRRWRNLWSGSVSSLDFTGLNVFDRLFGRNFLKEKQKELRRNERQYRRFHMKHSLQLPHFKRRKEFLDNQRTKFINRVNRVMKLRSDSIIDNIMISFPLGKEYTPQVDRWMGLAAARGARNLQLDCSFGHLGIGYSSDMLYVFPFQQFGSSLNHVQLEMCTLKFPPDFRGLNSLVSLTLINCFLTKDDVHAIISNCPSLEFLSMAHCMANEASTLKFVGPSTSLKHLCIDHCIRFVEIEIQDLNLLSFELLVSGFLPKLKLLSIKNCPLLARLALHLDKYGSLKGHVNSLTNVPRLETLLLNYQVSKVPKLTGLNNLKRLVFSAQWHKANLFEVLWLLEDCPLLQHLHVDMSASPVCDGEMSEQRSKIKNRPECPHGNLKEVEIYGFDGHSEQIELAKYLLRNAMVLEKMKLCTTCKTYRGQGEWIYGTRPLYPLRRSPDEVRRLLLKEKCAYTQLVLCF